MRCAGTNAGPARPSRFAVYMAASARCSAPRRPICQPPPPCLVSSKPPGDELGCRDIETCQAGWQEMVPTSGRWHQGKAATRRWCRGYWLQRVGADARRGGVGRVKSVAAMRHMSESASDQRVQQSRADRHDLPELPAPPPRPSHHAPQPQRRSDGSFGGVPGRHRQVGPAPARHAGPRRPGGPPGSSPPPRPT